MKTISAEMTNHLQGEVTSLASCWQIARQDGQNFYFTDHDRDLSVDGNLYRATGGYNRSALKGSSGLDTDEMELLGVLGSDLLREEDLRAGLYDYAEIRFFVVNWQNLGAGILPLRKGWIGEVSWKDGQFTAELRGLTNALQRQIGSLYTPECPADLGDSRCKIDLEAIAENDVVAAVNDARNITLTSYAGADGALDGGILSFTSGPNMGRSVEIEKWVQEAKELTLFLDIANTPEAGDQVRLYPGCDKRFSTCRDQYSNLVNFRGFPHVPGTDTLLENSNG